MRTALEFRVPWPLEVVVGGEVRGLPAGAERALLELLLPTPGSQPPSSP